MLHCVKKNLNISYLLVNMFYYWTQFFHSFVDLIELFTAFETTIIHTNRKRSWYTFAILKENVTLAYIAITTILWRPRITIFSFWKTPVEYKRKIYFLNLYLTIYRTFKINFVWTIQYKIINIILKSSRYQTGKR